MRPLVAPAGTAAVLALVLVGAFLAGCQASQPSTVPSAATPSIAASPRPPTTAEGIRLKAAVERWRLANAVRGLRLRKDLKSALHVWTFRHDVRLAIAAHQARQAYIALIRRVSGGTGAGTIPVSGALGGVAVARLAIGAAPARYRSTRPLAVLVAAPNQCRFDLGGQDSPPPVSQATLRWLSGQPPIDEEPPPVSQETLDWIAAQDAAEPPPVSQETLDWIAQNEHDTNPPPVSEETLRWIEEHEATDTNPPPVSQETLDWIAEQEAAEPPPVSQETLDWIAQNEHDTNPPPVSQETLDWIAAQEDAGSNPPPISDELQRWLDEHDSGGPSSPPASAPTATSAPSARPCGWSIDQASGGGRIKGKHCGDVPGQWIVDGTYDVGGFKGTQKWTIAIDANMSTGTFTYSVRSKGRPLGAPVTVYLSGNAAGTATLAIDPADGTAHMILTETMHVYGSTTDKGGSGHDQDAPLETSRLDWFADPTC